MNFKKQEIKIQTEIVNLNFDLTEHNKKIKNANSLQEVKSEIQDIAFYLNDFKVAEKKFDDEIRKLKMQLYIKKHEVESIINEIKEKAKKEFNDKAKYKEITKRIVNDETGEVHFIKTLKLINNPLPKGIIYRKGSDKITIIDESKLDDKFFKKVLKKKEFNEAIKRGEIDTSLYKIDKGEPSVSIDAWKLENE